MNVVLSIPLKTQTHTDFLVNSTYDYVYLLKTEYVNT